MTVSNTFYVSPSGDDTNSGTTLDAPVATPAQGLALAKQTNQPSQIFVYPGDYEIAPDTEVPKDCVFSGVDLRTVNLRLPEGQEENIMLRLNSGCRVTGFTFRRIRQPAATINLETREYVPPTTGFACGFLEGAFIVRSPYISNCTVFNDLTVEEMRDPIDRANGNPLIPRVGGNLICDGSIINANSPLRSIVVDSFTAINPNGVAYVITRSGFVQLVSVFTNWSRVGLWCHDGGHVTVANSNSSFGDYAIASTGFRNIVQIPVQIGQPRNPNPALADQIINSRPMMIDDIWTQLRSEFPTQLTTNPAIEASCRADLSSLLDAISDDVRAGQDRSTQNFLYSFFNWNGEHYVRESFRPIVLRGWEIAQQEIITGTVNTATPLVNSLFDLLSRSYRDPPMSSFGSLVEANSQQLSYVGAGVNLNALPVSQRGTGVGTSDSSRVFIRDNGGVLNVTYSTEVGDTFLGEDLRVDFNRGVIEGNAFSRGVANITLPLLIALGSD